MRVTTIIRCRGEVAAMGKGDGVGDEQYAAVDGDVYKILIERDGQSQFGIHIGEDGQLTITDYCGMNYLAAVPQNFCIYPLRPWTGTPGGGDLGDACDIDGGSRP